MSLPSESAIKATSEIIVAFLASGPISAAELPQLVRRVLSALDAPADSRVVAAATANVSIRAVVPQPTPNEDLAAAPPGERASPAVPIEASIQHDYLVSLEDGNHYRSLKRHLMAKYGMTPDDYRRKWGLPRDYPMVAPSYAEERSEVAKRTGLGLSHRHAGPERRSAKP